MEGISEQEKTQTPLSEEEGVWNKKMEGLQKFLSDNDKILLSLYGPDRASLLDDFKLKLFRKIAGDLKITEGDLREQYASIHPLISSGTDFETCPIFDNEEGDIVNMVVSSYVQERDRFSEIKDALSGN